MDYLEQLQAEGHFDSHGCFTLDFAASRSRYMRLAQSDPSAYLRLFIQGIAASQPSRLDIQTRGRTLSLRWTPSEAYPWAPTDLQRLHSYLQGQQDEYTRPHLQYLKLAMILASCRAELRFSLTVGSQRAAWLGEAFQWETAAPVDPVLQLEKIGAEWDVRSLESDSFLSVWPELGSLRPELAQLAPRCFIQGQEQLPRVPYGWAMLAPEFLRVAIVHPEASLNKVPLLMEPAPKPVAWLQPITQRVVDVQGRPLHFSPGQRQMCYFAARIYLGDVHLQEDFWGKAPARCHLNLLREGFTLDLPNGLVPRSCVAMMEASELSTDLSFRKPTRHQALVDKVGEARRWLSLAVDLGLDSVAEAPAWQAFLQGSRRERLQTLRRELNKPSDRWVALLGVV